MAARFAFMALRSGAAVSGSVGGGFSPGLPMTPPAPLTPDLSTVTVFFSDLPFLMASSRALRSAIALALAVHDTTRAPEERRTRGSERGAQSDSEGIRRPLRVHGSRELFTGRPDPC